MEIDGIGWGYPFVVECGERSLVLDWDRKLGLGLPLRSLLVMELRIHTTAGMALELPYSF